MDYIESFVILNGLELLLKGAGGFKFVKKEWRNNRWKYWYKDPITGKLTDKPPTNKQDTSTNFQGKRQG